MPSILPALRVLLFASALLSLLTIGACGLKGDLVLPEADEPSSSEQAEEVNADDEDGDDSRMAGSEAA